MMIQLFDLKILVVLSFALLAGCQKVNTEFIAIPAYPDLKEVYHSQTIGLGTRSLDKDVSIGEKSESKTMSMDSLKWKDELSFMLEMNPNQSEYVGVFDILEDGKSKTLTLKEGEKGILKSISFTSTGDSYSRITATIHEDKDVYVHHREIKIAFENGLIKSWNIKGYQKMVFTSTVKFEIIGEIN